MTEVIEAATDRLEGEAPVSIFEKEAKKMFTRYNITLVGVTSICGGLPSDPKMIAGWLQRNAGMVKGDEQHKRMFVETLIDLGYEIDDPEAMSKLDEGKLLDQATQIVQDKSKLVQFARTDLGELALPGRYIKSMLKEGSNILFPYPDHGFSKTTGKPTESRDTKKVKGLRALISEWVYPVDRLIGLGTTEARVEEKVGHTSNGAHLSVFEVIDNWEISFQLEVLHDLVDEKVWASLWTYSERNGLGANRSQGHGQFKITAFGKV